MSHVTVSLNIRVLSFVFIFGLSTSFSCNSRFKLGYLSNEDIPNIAELISNNFNGPFKNWWDAPAKLYSFKTTVAQLELRQATLVGGKSPHAMIVVRDENVPIGYVEVGMMPSKIMFDEKQPLIPHIGNLVVATHMRRRGLGVMLMQKALDEALSWNETKVVCCVEPQNSVAKQLYIERLGFEIVGIEHPKFLDSRVEHIVLMKGIQINGIETSDSCTLPSTSFVEA